MFDKLAVTLRRLLVVAAMLVGPVLLYSQAANAIPVYTGNVIAQCATINGVTTNATATLTTAGWTMGVMTYTFQPGNQTFTGSSGVDPNNNQVAHFSLPPGTYTVYVGTPNVPGTPVGPNSPDIQATYTIIVASCVIHNSSLSVRKTVINTTGINTAGTVFPVDVSCAHTIHTTLNLSNSGGMQQMVSNIPIGSSCSIQEHNIPAPAGCSWSTTYPHGQSITLSGYAGYVLPVQNELVCSKCPPGTTEQVWPGTRIKFCCKDKLDPHSDKFCCTREQGDAKDENER